MLYLLQLNSWRSLKAKNNITLNKITSFKRNVYTLEFRIDGTPRLLIIPFFATLPNLIQHFSFINSGEFCQPTLLLHTHRLLIHVHSRRR